MRRSHLLRGVTSVEVIVVIGVIAFLLVLLLPALKKARCGAQSLKDKTHVTQIQKAMLGFASEHRGVFPTPGLAAADHKMDGATPRFEDNHSAPLYSYMVALNLVKPDLLVMPDRSCGFETAAVVVKSDYNYSAIDPAAGKFWDTTFSMRIDSLKNGANGSYAHAALCGDRLLKQWRDTQRQAFAVIGTRGTRNGVTTGDDYTRSPTLKFHLPKKVWVGNVCFADNHSESVTDFHTGTCAFEVDGNRVKDNLFAAEFSHPEGNQAAADSFLGVFIGSTEFTVDPIYDALE